MIKPAVYTGVGTERKRLHVVFKAYGKCPCGKVRHGDQLAALLTGTICYPDYEFACPYCRNMVRAKVMFEYRWVADN